MKEVFIQEGKMVNEAVLLDQQSVTKFCLLELPAVFVKQYVLFKRLAVFVDMHFLECPYILVWPWLDTRG